MKKNHLLAASALFLISPLYAATPIDLASQSSAFLVKKSARSASLDLQETQRETDFNQTLHVRVQQMYQGIPVIGGDAVIHIPNQAQSSKSYLSLLSNKSFMNGVVFENLQKDLSGLSSHVFNPANQEKAVKQALMLTQAKSNLAIDADTLTVKSLVFVDADNQAHWAYQISFLGTQNQTKIKPAYILDAVNGQVYQYWNDLKTLDNVSAGGYAGNHKTGQKILDGLPGHYPALDVSRDAAKRICFMQNDYMVLTNHKTDKTMQFTCAEQDPAHGNIYWNASHDQVATTWSPSNDVMFGIDVGRRMYQDWYQVPVLIKNGQPMLIKATVHDADENAYWDGSKVIFGDSLRSKYFNPFTQLDTVVHELSHGFTEQHANLAYYGQSGGLNEAFSDMAGIAGEYYSYGKTDFLVGLGDVKAEGKALRYMDKPSRDCEGNQPGDGCSIDHMSQYNNWLDVHFSSGIFNRVYYSLANMPGWDAKKAFDVMVQANRFYWTSGTSFAQAACGVMKAAGDYQYDTKAVGAAFQVVGIDTSKC